MWVVTMFDLPVDTKAARREYGVRYTNPVFAPMLQITTMG
jgi:CRISPR/Cas system-associated protein endoribonuclease Cas2